jgi:hypothetical protein
MLELDDKAVHHAFALIVEPRRTTANKIVESALVLRGQRAARLTPELHFFVEHGDFDIAREDFFHLRAG